MEYAVVCLQGCSSPLSGAFTPLALVVAELVFSSPRCAPCLQQEHFHLSAEQGPQEAGEDQAHTFCCSTPSVVIPQH